MKKRQSRNLITEAEMKVRKKKMMKKESTSTQFSFFQERSYFVRKTEGLLFFFIIFSSSSLVHNVLKADEMEGYRVWRSREMKIAEKIVSLFLSTKEEMMASTLKGKQRRRRWHKRREKGSRRKCLQFKSTLSLHCMIRFLPSSSSSSLSLQGMTEKEKLMQRRRVLLPSFLWQKEVKSLSCQLHRNSSSKVKNLEQEEEGERRVELRRIKKRNQLLFISTLLVMHFFSSFQDKSDVPDQRHLLRNALLSSLWELFPLLRSCCSDSTCLWSSRLPELTRDQDWVLRGITNSIHTQYTPLNEILRTQPVQVEKTFFQKGFFPIVHVSVTSVKGEKRQSTRHGCQTKT